MRTTSKHSTTLGWVLTAGLVWSLASCQVEPEKPRSLAEKLDDIDAQLGGSPTQETLAGLFASVRGAELAWQAAEAGADPQVRLERLQKAVYKAYVDSLRAAATAAASSTTGAGLAPFGTLEDVLRTLRDDAIVTNDREAQQLYTPMWKQVCSEIDGITLRLFDEAYCNQIPWQDLLADATGWAPIASSSFAFEFGHGLSLTNAAEGATGGLAYFPKGDEWRDYVIDMEFELGAGRFSFYTRIGDKMDSKECPAITVFPPGQRNPNVHVEYGTTYQLVVSVIANHLVVRLDGEIVYLDDIRTSKSRKGEPGIAVPVGTNLTIHRLKVRVLR